MDQRTPTPARPDVGAPDYDDLLVFLERHEDGFDAECAYCLGGDPLVDRLEVLEDNVDATVEVELAEAYNRYSAALRAVGTDRYLREAELDDTFHDIDLHELDALLAVRRAMQRLEADSYDLGMAHGRRKS